MTLKELEKRVSVLEREIKQLWRQWAVRTAEHVPSWERAVEEFRGDEDIVAVLREAMKLREKERRAVRRKWSKNAKRGE